ncbi:unnamed protein product [Nippostrongylus brasiliensis]|uniref:AraC family transcriptional regulator n=1 Tax=Nippostrongylus brasiliensis TaxID=27835 RepID=A0A0N4YX66_NIPBR|nr:unnamed protein product [Nippostrongylus brasiliensis]
MAGVHREQLNDPKSLIRTYLSLPFNAASRLVGGIANREIPVWLREPLLGGFARIYDCRMDEAVQPDFRSLTALLRDGPFADVSLSTFCNSSHVV